MSTTVLVIAELKIKCLKCAKEEDIVEILEDSTIDFNLDKLCPKGQGMWMTKNLLTIGGIQLSKNRC